MRPNRVVVVAGTGTEVGKTFVGAAIAREIATRGHKVIARKPAQSYEADDVSTDATVLAEATNDDPEMVCPAHRWYPIPMAPPMAATALGRDGFTVDDLAEEVHTSFHGADIALVETAGGSWSPQASDGTHVGDFAEAVRADGVLLVADAGLGVINAVRGALAALGADRPVVVMLNRYSDDDALHVANRDWLVREDKLNVVTTVAEATSAVLAL